MPVAFQAKQIQTVKKNKTNLVNFENRIFEFPSYEFYSSINFKGLNEITPQRMAQLSAFQEKYGLEFNNIHLLNQAFLFGTYETGENIHHNDTYERLEFIGDDVLELCVNKILYENYPDYTEGELTKLKQQIVSNENISKYSKKLGLDKMTSYVPINKRLADIFEALLGAIFIDGKQDGFKNAYSFFETNLKEDVLSKKLPQNKSSKTILEEYIVNNGGDLADLNYCVIYKDRICQCEVSYQGEILASVEAGSERKARQNAFRQALAVLVELEEA